MIRLATLGSAAALCLAACNAPPKQPGAPEPAEPSTAAAAKPAAPATGEPVSAGDKLTANGYGALRIGMTLAEIEAAMGPDANPDEAGGPEPEYCDLFHPARAPEGLLVMVEKGILTSVWITPGSTVETDRGLNVGDPAAEVKRVYGAAAETAPHEYSDPPAEYLTVWTRRDRSGLKYTVGPDGKVESIAGGGPSISYVEGCA